MSTQDVFATRMITSPGQSLQGHNTVPITGGFQEVIGQNAQAHFPLGQVESSFEAPFILGSSIIG